jgi:hypothetical protein
MVAPSWIFELYVEGVAYGFDVSAMPVSLRVGSHLVQDFRPVAH